MTKTPRVLFDTSGFLQTLIEICKKFGLILFMMFN
jgi:hypothetical protein